MFPHNHHLMEATQFIIRDSQQDLTDSFRQTAIDKTAPLFRHNVSISCIRIDLEIDPSSGPAQRFVAKGLLEVDGPDIFASARSENAYKSVDLLVEKLDALFPLAASDIIDSLPKVVTSA
jgi:putative sigma-54 modulation protein